MTIAEHLSFNRFAERLEMLRRDIETRDPDGVDFALRTALSCYLFLFHDELRCREGVFDRRAFATRLDDAATVLARAEPVAAAEHVRRPRPAYEEYVSDLYSRCWSKYDDAAFTETIGFFEERFRLNDADLAALQGGECLDAGCGSGRYTMAMVEAGAQRAVGLDISERAIQEAADRAGRLGYASRTEFVRGSAVELPRGWTDRFDFACSNGVVHHTPDPVAAVGELFRVLKPGGQLYIMVYGTGGLFWALVDFVRAILEPVPLDFADAWLELAGTPVGKLFFCLDHWYTPYQERVSRAELEDRLRDCGFVQLRYLPRARIYDTSERLFRYPEEADLIGEPDPRYLARTPA